MKSTLKVIGMLVLAPVAVLGLIFSFAGILYPFASYGCGVKAQQMNVPHVYGLFAGCMVKVAGGQWIDIEKVQLVDLRGIH